VTRKKDDWTEQIVELMSRFPHLYADVGAHSVAYGAPHMDDYVQKLKRLFAQSPVLADRLMLGTDWHTIVRNPKHEDFISRYKKLFAKAFGDAALPKLMGGNALSFLGLDKPGGKNRVRLEAFYARHAIPKPHWWVA
jgi:predicted TIM-barrel fold metal-dependent hydrolase